MASGEKAKRPGISCQSANLTSEQRQELSLFHFVLFAFNLHIAELAGFENFAAFLAFDVLGILITRDDANSGVGTRHIHEIVVTGKGGIPSDCTHRARNLKHLFDGVAATRIPALIALFFDLH
jgi:hypothetical protein